MQTEKQKWLDEVLNSTDGVSRAPMRDMTDAIISRIGTTGQHNIVRPNDSSLLLRIAASLFFLVAVNAVTVVSYQNNIKKIQRQQSSVEVSGLGMEQSIGDPGAAFFGK